MKTNDQYEALRLKYLTEFDSINAALNAVLDEHLGPSPDRRFGANNIMASLLLPAGVLTPAMSRKQELEKLSRLNRAAREFASAWRDLHFHLRGEICDSGNDYLGGVKHLHEGNLNDRDRTNFRRHFWYTFAYLDKMVGAAVPKARALIDAAPEVGKSDMRLVDVIHSLRVTWGHRKGKPAPKNVADGSAFYRFVDAAFTVIGLKRDVRSAMDAWRRFEKKHPNTVRRSRRGRN
jgi:hypothetical protein